MVHFASVCDLIFIILPLFSASSSSSPSPTTECKPFFLFTKLWPTTLTLATFKVLVFYVCICTGTVAGLKPDAIIKFKHLLKVHIFNYQIKTALTEWSLYTICALLQQWQVRRKTALSNSFTCFTYLFLSECLTTMRNRNRKTTVVDIFCTVFVLCCATMAIQHENSSHWVTNHLSCVPISVLYKCQTLWRKKSSSYSFFYMTVVKSCVFTPFSE